MPRSNLYHDAVSTSSQTGHSTTPHCDDGTSFDLRVDFFSRPTYLAVIRQMVDTLCGRLGFPPADASRICLAVDEALCNVIRHGYDLDPDGPITLTIREPDAEQIVEFIVEDRARQVEIDTIRSRDLNDVRPGGLGVHLISEIMDSAEWRHREGGGMRLVMQKRIPATQMEAKGCPPGPTT